MSCELTAVTSSTYYHNLTICAGCQYYSEYDDDDDVGGSGCGSDKKKLRKKIIKLLNPVVLILVFSSRESWYRGSTQDKMNITERIWSPEDMPMQVIFLH